MLQLLRYLLPIIHNIKYINWGKKEVTMKYGNMIDETNISYAFIIFYFILTKNYSIIKCCKRIKLLFKRYLNVHL